MPETSYPDAKVAATRRPAIENGSLNIKNKLTQCEGERARMHISELSTRERLECRFRTTAHYKYMKCRGRCTYDGRKDQR